jgi:endogenous inhibitor of DNA gyrase (YacG/DUF329 family)/transposase
MMTSRGLQGGLTGSNPAAQTPSPRTRQILAAARQGTSYAEIGRRFRVSGSRVRQLARQWGLPPRVPVRRIQVRCQTCGNQIITPVTMPRKFCSKRCFYLSPLWGQEGRLRVDPGALARQLGARKRTCRVCGKEFLAQGPSQERPFCSRRCAGRAHSKLSDEDLRSIKIALGKNRTYQEIARRFGVTRQYIHYLARTRSLPRRRRSRQGNGA